MLHELKVVLETLTFLVALASLYIVYSKYRKCSPLLLQKHLRYSQHVVVAFTLLATSLLLELVDSFLSGFVKEVVSTFQMLLWAFFFVLLASGLQYLYLRGEVVD